MADEIQKLKTDIALNQTIIIVGAHVSFYTTNGEQQIAHWKGLIKHGLYRCHQSRGLTNAEFAYFMNKFQSNTAGIDDYLSATNRIKDFLKKKSHITNEDAYGSWLRATLGTLVPQKPEIITAIGELECPILTTNYDSLLASILRRNPLTWNRYCVNSNDHSSDNMNRSILHLYGHFEEPESVIFSSGDYKRILQNSSGLSKLRSLIKAQTILFIGFETRTADPYLSNLLKWIFQVTEGKPLSMYSLVRANPNKQLNPTFSNPFSSHINEIPYGTSTEDLLSYITSLKSFRPIMRDSLLLIDQRDMIRRKYLLYLIEEYGHVPMLGYSNSHINLPLESVYVELKFDPTHPSIKAMQTVEINEEFKRKLFSRGFFDENERNKIVTVILERSIAGSETIYRDFMVEQWLTVFLGNRNIFTTSEATTIKNKINRLKQKIMEKNKFQEAKQYRIQRAYEEFKHFIILGHPGSGKTTLSKWLVINMAKECLGEENLLFERGSSVHKKIPVLIPIWKYVDQAKQNHNHHKKSLLQFIYENLTFDSPFFDDEERRELSLLMIESLVQGNVLVIFEGLDEVPAHVDRSDLMKEINILLERGIDYDHKSQQLTYSIYEQKEINNIKNPNIGNRFIVTSRIEGNYFEDINFYIPRLTIENMSNEALRLFCSSYMQCIQQMSNGTDQLYNDISRNRDIFQLAINPQLASIIAALYHQCEGRLPEKRIDLYDRAIETMIERLVASTSDLGAELKLTSTMLWSILQEIAEYLHSKVEGLSEKVLRKIIDRCLMNASQQSAGMNDSISRLVNIFKYQAGLLNEFGQNSFRFIHRTFQEYLAAKSMIYSNGKERSEEVIYENIISKIGIPNWRVPLSMTFGILSKLSDQNDLFQNILRRLLVNEQPSIVIQFSTLLVPLIIADSLNDMYFPSKDKEYQLIQSLADLLLIDYRNMSGFARLKDHQELIHSYFLKFKQTYNQTITEWFFTKLTHPENLAACANIAHQLQWYEPMFYEVFVENLHHDSEIWNWPIDSLLRFYSKEIQDETIVTKLKCKTMLKENPRILESIKKDSHWFRLMVALYGGHENYKNPSTISEYHEIAQFLSLTQNEMTPFLFYYQEVWGRDDPAHNMVAHLDSFMFKNDWDKTAMFVLNNIYKDTFLTSRIFQLLSEERSAVELVEDLRMQIGSATLTISNKIDGLIALSALEDFEFIHHWIRNGEKVLLERFANRIEQLISVLADPIARCSSSIEKYLLTIYRHMKLDPSIWNVTFIDYCRIYLSLSAYSGALPIDTKMLARRMENIEDKSYLYAECWASVFTGANNDVRYAVAVLLEQCIALRKSNEIIKAFLKINDAVQIYKPVRAYPWPMDTFIFRWNEEDDIPIAFFNCLENINTNLASTIQTICNVFIKEDYFTRQCQLIPLVVLFNLGMMSKDLDSSEIFKTLLPELAEQSNKKEFLLEKIQSMSDPYYKSRALYQLAQLYDQKSYQLLSESFALSRQIGTPVLKFQVLEKIFAVIHYKNVEQKSFIRQIIDELAITCDQIEDPYDQTIASIRLSFYGSGSFRHKYLGCALQTLMKMDEDDQQIKLIIKLKPPIALFDDLRMALDEFIQNITNKTCQDLAQCRYGKILSSQKSIFERGELSMDDENKSTIDYMEVETLFSLYAQLKDVKSMLGVVETMDQLWIRLFRDPHNQSNVTKILEIGLKNELFLTPQVAIIFDELIRQGNEDCITVLYPYMIKPSNEILPVVQRWFTDYQNQSIGKLAALLLAESKYLFESAVNIIIDLLRSDNDQMRYRAQRVFQHPERDVREPSKRISVIGERTMIKILENIHLKEHPPRIRTYLGTFFFDLIWDDPQVFRNLYEHSVQAEETHPSDGRRMRYFNRILFMNLDTWDAMIESAQSPSAHPLYVEALLQSVMRLTNHGQISEQQMTQFAGVLSTTDTTHFAERLYFSRTDVETIQFIVNEICTLTDICDETYLEVLESKLIHALTIKVEDISAPLNPRMNRFRQCNFYASTDLNDTVLNIFINVPLNRVNLTNFINLLIYRMATFRSYEDSWYSLMLSSCILVAVAACVQKDDYLYRKITNDSQFDKLQMTKLLEKMIHQHLFFPARGSAFILLAALDQVDHKVIINAMNALFDENCVKEFAMIGIPLIHLSPNELLDDLLSSLTSESAVKAYEILKIITQFALNEQIDADGKSKIINYLANEIGQMKSKKPINYYYTDVKIPFTTTSENELYKAWIKIQGLSGKTQYSKILDTSSS